MTRNSNDTDENLKESSKIIPEINAIRTRSQMGTEDRRMILKLFKTCLMPVIKHALKKVLPDPLSTSTAEVLMETDI